MSNRLICLVATMCLALALGVTESAYAQADPQNYRFNAGQTIQPFFEGWAHNPDGSFEMHFGYLNRNYVEELHIPIGAENRLTPDGPDRGQPTFFYPHVNHRVFSVTVPANWSDKELVWQMTVRDETFRAVGWLQPEWEIAANARGGFFAAAEGAATNQGPTLRVDAARIRHADRDADHDRHGDRRWTTGTSSAWRAGRQRHAADVRAGSRWAHAAGQRSSDSAVRP